jgi:acetylornithine aminotransferase
MNHLLWYPGHHLLLPDIVRADNCSLYDAQGNRYVDLESGVWCTAIGHAHPRVCAVLADQPARIGHTGFCYTNRIVEESAQAVLALLGFSDGQCVFLCSGSEAVEYGVRVVQAIAERPLLLTMADTYSGAYGSAHRQAPDEWFRFDWLACAACRDGGECSQDCEHWAAIPFDQIGGLLFEPGSSSGLVRFPPPRLVQNLVARIRAQGGLVLVNEVTTGIGRTGTWFGYQHYGIVPDIVALGKGIGNGYPVSVAAFAPDVCERLASKPVKYSQSHQNDPLGAAIARTVIEVIQQDGLIERGQELAAFLLAGLQGIQERTGQIEAIRARGLMLALVLRDEAAGSFTLHTHQELVRQGYIVGWRPGTNVLRLDPSLTIDQQDIAGFLELLEAVLTAEMPIPEC